MTDTPPPEPAAAQDEPDLTAQAEQQLRDAAEQLEQAKAQALAGFEDAAANVTEYVRREPVKSLAIAAGAGLLLGVLLKR
jgi:ElaB/YqjD/DUF883 family membrane-anchored ribosome-binding protein